MIYWTLHENMIYHIFHSNFLLILPPCSACVPIMEISPNSDGSTNAVTWFKFKMEAPVAPCVVKRSGKGNKRMVHCEKWHASLTWTGTTTTVNENKFFIITEIGPVCFVTYRSLFFFFILLFETAIELSRLTPLKDLTKKKKKKKTRNKPKHDRPFFNFLFNILTKTIELTWYIAAQACVDAYNKRIDEEDAKNREDTIRIVVSCILSGTVVLVAIILFLTVGRM